MTAFHPLSPARAIQALEAEGVANAALLLRDYAEAGLIKTYARAVLSAEASGEKRAVRNGALPRSIWERIVRADADEQVWTGGTVRLPGSGLIGGEPEISVTGIGFHSEDLSQIVQDQLGPKRRRGAAQAQADHPPAEAEKVTTEEAATRRRRKPDPSRLAPGVMLLTIADAGAALGIGRTKVNELMNASRLERVSIDGSVRITVASVRALAEPAS